MIGFSREEWNVEYEFHKNIRRTALCSSQAFLGKSLSEPQDMIGLM